MSALDRHRPELRTQAQGRWRSILPALGVSAQFLDGKQHPCPVCGGKDRARFDDLDGNGTWICNHCGAGDGASLAMKVTGLGFVDMAKRVREILPEAPIVSAKPRRDDAKCLARARDVWRASLPIVGTMAEEYLRSRGAWIDHLATSDVLRFAPRCREVGDEERYLPALLARVTDKSGAGVNVHRTYLVDGRKAYRAMMPGALPDGSAIRIGAPVRGGLGIAEGLETALRASIRFGVPCWSSITAGGMERWSPPQGVESVHIFGDSDFSFAGQASAYILARKLTNRREPVRCAVHLPDALGIDWADEDPMLECAA